MTHDILLKIILTAVGLLTTGARAQSRRGGMMAQEIIITVIGAILTTILIYIARSIPRGNKTNE